MCFAGNQATEFYVEHLEAAPRVLLDVWPVPRAGSTVTCGMKLEQISIIDCAKMQFSHQSGKAWGWVRFQVAVWRPCGTEWRC